MVSPNAASSPPPSHPISPDFAASLVKRVRSLIERGQLNAASLLLPTLTKLCPDHDAVALIAAEIAIYRGNLDVAATAIQEGLDRHPNSAALLLLRARLNLTKRDLVAAAVDAADAVMSEPGNSAAKSVLGQALLELRQTDQAVICLREALIDLPDDMPTIAALTKASPADAEAAIRNAIAQGNRSISLHNALIAALLAGKNIDAATAEIKSLTVAGEADPQTGLLAVQAAIDSENWSEATVLFNKTTGHLPRHA